MTDMQNKELSFVVIERQLIGWHLIVNIVNAWLHAQFRCSWLSSSSRLERQINLAIISIKMMVHVVFTDDVYFDSWSWQSFVSTCDVFNCLLPLDVQNEIQLLSGVFCCSWVICLLGFGWEICRLWKSEILGWHRFRLLHCLMRKRFEKSEVILALLD